MRCRNGIWSVVLLACLLLFQTTIAHAQQVVASWIQLGPGSSGSALSHGQYGDQPTSLTPTILARAIVSDGVCPALTVDGTMNLTMSQRVSASQLTSTPGTKSFNNDPASVGGTYPQSFVSPSQTSSGNLPDGTAKATTSWAECEAVVPAGHREARIGHTALKLPVAHPEKILVIADTGCRMASANQQDCHSALSFPFMLLAGFEASFKPDLIIHVGDYFYRDTNCVVPASGSTAAHEFVPGCSDPTNAAYETWGDTFDSWNADFVYPGRSLLAAAPWVMTRGNHESCGRGARGWFALLDPRPFDINQVDCAGGAGAAKVSNGPVYSGDFTPSYMVPAGEVNLIVHDSSYANDSAVDANMAANYDYDLTALLNTLPVSPYNFYVTHKPSYGLVSGAPNNGGDFTEQYAFSGNATSNSAFANGNVPYKIALFLSGHIHQFEYVNFNDYTRFAPQLIVGVGGDNLDPTANPDGTTPTYGYASQPFTIHDMSATADTNSAVVNRAYAQAEFGFALLTKSPTGFNAHVYSVNQTKAGRCTVSLNPRGISCWD